MKTPVYSHRVVIMHLTRRGKLTISIRRDGYYSDRSGFHLRVGILWSWLHIYRSGDLLSVLFRIGVYVSITLPRP